MLSAAFTLFMHGAFLCLRLRGSGGSFPRPLTDEEECLALEAMCRGDTMAREKLILHNMRLVAHVIKKFYTNANDQDDLISIGTIGLVKAVDSYRPDKCIKLPTYACKCIQNEIFMYFRSRKKLSGEIFLGDQLENDNDGAPLTVMDVLQTEDYTQERLELDETYSKVAELVKDLPDDRMRSIICLRYGLDGGLPHTQRETAQRLGISRSYVSRIEKKALGILEVCLSDLYN